MALIKRDVILPETRVANLCAMVPRFIAFTSPKTFPDLYKYDRIFPIDGNFISGPSLYCMSVA